jgi:hypothetical protein
MKSVRGKDQWVWVIVQDPGGKEQFLGQHDQQENISFIPAFHSKEEAQQCFMNIFHLFRLFIPKKRRNNAS